MMSQNIQISLAIPAPAPKKHMSFSSFNIRHKPDPGYAEKMTRRSIKELHGQVEKILMEAKQLLLEAPPDSSCEIDLKEAISNYIWVSRCLSDLLKNALILPDRARACLQYLLNHMTVELSEYTEARHYFLQYELDAIKKIIHTTDQEIAQVQPKPEAEAILVTAKPTIQVPADLLFQTYYSLFPAERMVVISGRRSGDTVVLGAAFDVTGVANGGYVSADPALLARALISMDLSNTYLAAWVHSHPGHGIRSTFPSEIDLRQHAEWIRNYSPHLLSAIIVQDRYIRFWGTALAAQELSISLQLPGLTQEDANDHVYRLIN